MALAEIAGGKSTPMPSHPQDKLIRRVVSFKNPFDAMELARTESLENIQKKYKKLALILHPDKCNHPRAEEAFDALKKALKQLENEDKRKQFADLMERAENAVLDDWKKQGKKRQSKPGNITAADPDSPEFEWTEDIGGDSPEFVMDVRKMTQRMIIELELEGKRAEDYRLANEKYEKEMKLKAAEELKLRDEEDRVWEDNRENRVESWRSFTSSGKKNVHLPKKVKPNPPSIVPPTASPIAVRPLSTPASSVQPTITSVPRPPPPGPPQSLRTTPTPHPPPPPPPPPPATSRSSVNKRPFT